MKYSSDVAASGMALIQRKLLAAEIVEKMAGDPSLLQRFVDRCEAECAKRCKPAPYHTRGCWERKEMRKLAEQLAADPTLELDLGF